VTKLVNLKQNKAVDRLQTVHNSNCSLHKTSLLKSAEYFTVITV